MIFAGSLTEKLEFYKIVEVQSATGFKHTEEVFKFRCNAYRMKNKEKLVEDAEEIFHSVSLTFKIRYRSIDETDIVKYNGKKYRIISLDKYPRENQITLILDLINE